MTDATYMIAPDAMASVHAALADANQRIAVLRTDAQRLTGMVDSLMRERNDLRAEVSDARGRVSYFQAESNQWRARYMAAHDVLLHAEAFIEAPIHGDDLHRWNKYTDMRAAFLAYRASIEAGAPGAGPAALDALRGKGVGTAAHGGAHVQSHHAPA